MDPKELLAKIKDVKAASTEEMPFSRYLEKVAENPKLARMAHELVSDMIAYNGVSTGPEGEERFDLWEGELFGHEHVLEQVVHYFRAAGQRLDVRKRILLLVGPPGSGKSTLINNLKEGLEDYTRTEEGAVYAVKGSQVHEDPLRLIPDEIRGEMDIYVEGDLNPEVRWLVDNVYNGDLARVPVERVFYSVSEGIGFGTFVATDPRSENLRRLVGEVDMSRLVAGDDSSVRRAFRFDGELNAAHRGVADLIEVFKMDERFLAVLLTVSQEQMIKTSGPGTMYADEVILAQSNIAEYEELINNPKAVAMADRLVVVKVPFVLSVRNEVMIYEKMLSSSDVARPNVSPLAIPTAATFAVLTRLEHPGGGQDGLLRKMALYDGRYGAQGDEEDAARLRAKANDEGMTGLSPRYVINRLSQIAGNSKGCLDGLSVLDALWEGLPQRAGFTEDERERWKSLLTATQVEYDDMVRSELQRASVIDFKEGAENLARSVREDVQAWQKDTSGANVPALRRVERLLDVPQYRRDRFRDGLAAAFELKGQRGRPLHTRHPLLEEGIHRALVPSWTEVSRNYDDTAGMIVGNLQRGGWSKTCAENLVDYAAKFTGSKRERRREEQQYGWQ
jgi:serine protein kinase